MFRYVSQVSVLYHFFYKRDECSTSFFLNVDERRVFLHLLLETRTFVLPFLGSNSKIENFHIYVEWFPEPQLPKILNLKKVPRSGVKGKFNFVYGNLNPFIKTSRE